MINSLILTLFYVILGLFSLNIMILIHELGHYFCAKIFCIEIDCLQLGFGPEIKRIKKRMSSFSFAAIPFGGLCKFDNLSLYSVHSFKRILVYLAGPVANALSALLIFTVYLCLTGNNFGSSFVLSCKQCMFEVKMFYSAICSVILGKAKIKDIISGAFIASKNIGQLSAFGFKGGLLSGVETNLYLFSSVSLSLGVANLLPIPALDGGYILIGFIELLTNKTFSEKFYFIVQFIGLVLLLVVFPILRHI